VGQSVLRAMVAQGYDVVCLDVRSPLSLRRYQRLRAQGLAFRVAWCDLTRAESVREVIARCRPEAVAHLAAIIPFGAYANPALSEAVNVGGTRAVMEACNEQAVPPRLIFASSYSVFGPRNASKPSELLTPDSPVSPRDLYGAQKVRCERLLREGCRGELALLRLGAVLETDLSASASRPMFEFALAVPHAQRRHAVDARDVGLAVANACRVPIPQPARPLLIGGDASWRLTNGSSMDAIGKVSGIGALPKELSRPASPELDQSWYFEDWLDTTESQQMLKFQAHTFDDFLADLAREVGPVQRALTTLARPLALHMMKRWSPYYADNVAGTAKIVSMEQELLNRYPKAPKGHIVDLSEPPPQTKQAVSSL
jgi:nucleoside-diphosphate-sugar epimerase